MAKIRIYQVNDEAVDARYIRYASLDMLEYMGIALHKDHYKMVWEEESEDTDLENIFIRFNHNHPEGFKGHSLSVSDVVEIDGKYYYCDSFGFKEVEL